MGSEAKTTIRVGRQTFAGTAHLESTELLFRGETRVRIPLASITGVAVKAGALHVTHAEGTAVLALGDVMAGKWAAKIQSPPSVTDKLGVKAGMTVALLDVVDQALIADLRGRGATLVTGDVSAGAAMVLWRITEPDSLVRLAALTKQIARDGCIWIIHPRGDKSVADTVIFGAAKRAGLTATKVARISDTDTAEKLVIPRAAR